jgi:hypothetical protein
MRSLLDLNFVHNYVNDSDDYWMMMTNWLIVVGGILFFFFFLIFFFSFLFLHWLILVRLGLNGNSLARAGEVGLYHKGSWNMICDAGFDDTTAHAG